MDSLTPDENTIVSLGKQASSHIQTTNTEDLTYPPVRKDKPFTSEGKLGLRGLPQNGGKTPTEHMHNLGPSLGGGGLGGTENIVTKKMPIDKPTYLTKKAAIYKALEDATGGIDLEKISHDFEEDFLLKQASELLGQAETDLDKIAVALANTMADTFLAKVNGVVS
jgi:hypothetical protein